jgi:hypothetical protein
MGKVSPQTLALQFLRWLSKFNHDGGCDRWQRETGDPIQHRHSNRIDRSCRASTAMSAAVSEPEPNDFCGLFWSRSDRFDERGKRLPPTQHAHRDDYRRQRQHVRPCREPTATNGRRGSCMRIGAATTGAVGTALQSPRAENPAGLDGTRALTQPAGDAMMTLEALHDPPRRELCAG